MCTEISRRRVVIFVCLDFRVDTQQQTYDGTSFRGPRIVGGSPVSPGDDFGFQVSIQSSGSHFCGGSLITPNYVLSAAHCFGECLFVCEAAQPAD